MLLGNQTRTNENPGHAIGGAQSAIYFLKPASRQMYYYGESHVVNQSDKGNFPDGYLPPHSYGLPPKSGGLSSHRQTQILLSHTASLAGGLPGSGSATITFSQTATGGLVVSGSGTASITLSATGTILSVAAGSGSATITLSGSALIGALAGMSASGSITLTPTATIKAIGYLSGLSTNESEFSPGALARAVWDAIAVDFNEANSMGELLNNSGSGSNPWDALLASNNDPGTFGERVQKLLTLAKFIGLR